MPLGLEVTAGGRHDNDFLDFRQTAILPTSEEIESTEKPFYRSTDEIMSLPGHERISAHLDNQFRLLREDMLSELRDNIQTAIGAKKGQWSTLRLEGLSLASISCGLSGSRHVRPCAIGVTWNYGLESFQEMARQAHEDRWKKITRVLKHRAFGCLARGSEIVAFATIDREIDELLSSSPLIMLRISGAEATEKALLYLKLYGDVDFLVVNTPSFAYEPILKCLQETTDLPFEQDLFLFQKGDSVGSSNPVSNEVAKELEARGTENLQDILQTSGDVRLDDSQLESLLAGLNQKVSVIQGPPGTGKSFIGALIVKLLHDHTNEKIIVMSYTNHALDQFLEDLMDVGIGDSEIVRLGSRSTARTMALSLSEQRLTRSRSASSWFAVDSLRDEAEERAEELRKSFEAFQKLTVDSQSILSYLELENSNFYEAFAIPETEHVTVVFGERGKAVKSTYLYDRWVTGTDAGIFSYSIPDKCQAIWNLDQEARREKHRLWKKALLEEQATALADHVKRFSQAQKRWATVFSEADRELLMSKRIIGCTTTGAAIFSETLQRVSPGILLLEEAGEILESHVLSALTPDTKQLIMIGDHQQLRPKVYSYSLSFEKGDGYDLNVSLFERLVRAGYPHTTLRKQHRMCPEISGLVRFLSYPDLNDAEGTKSRPLPRGLQDRVIFFQHEHPETQFAGVWDMRDQNTSTSKRNNYEAEIVLKIVKYLGQQGYGTDKLVVLTPYLGQLHLLRQTLMEQNDPVLNDRDSHDLVKAGLLSQAVETHSKKPIKLSTIDNYQGEESDIVIVSLTRSNDRGDIGFMAAPERVNVMLSRARNVLIIVGNSSTFISSHKGAKCWRPLMDKLKSEGHLYDGLPVRCQSHPNVTAILQTARDFAEKCPDGGCSTPCGAKLRCGKHECPSKCHQLVDHSQMTCKRIVDWNCPRGHCSSLPCSQAKAICRFCEREDREKERKLQRDRKLAAER